MMTVTYHYSVGHSIGDPTSGVCAASVEKRGLAV